MGETKKHEHACCGGHGKEMTGCSCLNNPWMRILILFCAALVIFFMGVCVASKANDRFEKRHSFGQRLFNESVVCPMLSSSTPACGQEKNTNCPMKQAE